jgi:hypothetical protein
MSRLPQTSEPIPVAPSSSIYTTLAIIAVVAGFIGVAVLFLRASALGLKLI